jgi:hypothetical protein
MNPAPSSYSLISARHNFDKEFLAIYSMRSSSGLYHVVILYHYMPHDNLSGTAALISREGSRLHYYIVSMTLSTGVDSLQRQSNSRRFQSLHRLDIFRSISYISSFNLFSTSSWMGVAKAAAVSWNRAQLQLAPRGRLNATASALHQRRFEQCARRSCLVHWYSLDLIG